ncbi:hypothetical protein V2G26_006019 [Clonostachys chloroleuca]|uniref:Tyrosinase copper-binding domain-containing protein n=1 Tax=Clonostachys chloroleuca TaxID=1926264 RepID=A0AA35M5E3_9HYPO|nr:unnamed protein product [Clonostachys chloroleuca]
MRTSFLTIMLLQGTSVALAQPTTSDLIQASDEMSLLAGQAFQEAQAQANEAGLKKRRSHCSWKNIRIRREWGTLSKKERKSYIDAVKCLQSKPARTPADVAPGAKTRFDDYVATHINQTLNIHYTGNFLTWHRYFTWVYEEALRNECGYKGTQPYWDWAKTAATGLTSSPIFDGSDTSMSGDGAYEGCREDIVLGKNQPGLTPIHLPTGNGGGCVQSGPFKSMSVNLGPISLDSPGGETITNPNGPLSYNPRCLKRDLSAEVNRRYSNASSILSNILKPQDVADFQLQIQGKPGTGTIGIHGGGHYSLGGDPGRDVFTSPGDPAFYLHHSMLDRVWWIWQMLDPKKRVFSDSAISGTNTFLDSPPSANTTLDDYVDFFYAGGTPTKIRDLLSTVHGPFCYVYL